MTLNKTSLSKEVASIAPERSIVLFDGVCNLCNGAVDFIINRDPEKHFLFASLQSDIGQKVLESQGMSTAELDTILLLQNGKVYQKSTAALKIAARLRGGWPMLSVFRIIPRPLRDYAYKIIAQNRYRFFGQRETCRLPTPEERTRFLEG